MQGTLSRGSISRIYIFIICLAVAMILFEVNDGPNLHFLGLSLSDEPKVSDHQKILTNGQPSPQLDSRLLGEYPE